jgi:hypothetical protein
MTDQSGGIRVTVEDLETGETESKVVWNDYVIVTAGDHYVDGIVRHANGTTQLTIKREAP